MPLTNDYDIIKSPLVTERTTILKEKYNQYVFKVLPSATKSDIKRVVQKLFNVVVLNVRTANFYGKFRRISAGRPAGKKADWKKAIVTVKKGQEIKIEQEAV